ncbi:MAG TPA: hypothetical protein VFX31_05955 [Ktedonobacterales bacterium]|nr:hypothetical protein [Ktedonobacterales bacterium]
MVEVFGGMGMGRRTALTPELQAEICDVLGCGVDVETACRRVGIDKTTYYNWLKRGRAGEQPFAEFLDAADQAMATLEVDVTRNIIRASKSRWQAGAWWIKWQRTQGVQRVELTGKDGAPVTGTLTPESAELIRHRILFGDRPAKRLAASTPGVEPAIAGGAAEAFDGGERERASIDRDVDDDEDEL